MCAERYGCLADLCWPGSYMRVCVHIGRVSAVGCYSYLSTWCLPMIMVNNDDDDVIFTEAGGSEKESEKAHKRNTALHLMILSCLSADTDTENAVKYWYDVNMTIRRSSSSPFVSGTHGLRKKEVRL